MDYDETRIMDVNSKIAGWVEQLYVDYTGQWVKKGQPLLALYSPELVCGAGGVFDGSGLCGENARWYGSRCGAKCRRSARCCAAKVAVLGYFDGADCGVGKRRDRFGRTMPILAPRSGIVTHKDVLEGAYIGSGQHLYRIADLSVVWIYADVYEYEMPWVSKGQRAEVSLSYFAGRAV